MKVLRGVKLSGVKSPGRGRLSKGKVVERGRERGWGTPFLSEEVVVRGKLLLVSLEQDAVAPEKSRDTQSLLTTNKHLDGRNDCPPYYHDWSTT